MRPAPGIHPVAAHSAPRSDGATSTFSSRTRVLVLEPVLVEAQALLTLLRGHGYDVRYAESCASSQRSLADFSPDVIISNLILPDLRGAKLCEYLRTCSQAAITVVSAIDDEGACVEALRAGADDYVVRPVRMKEFVARIQAIVRRIHGWNRERVVQGDIAIDLGARDVVVADRHIHLRPHEFDLFLYLMRHPSEVHSYRTLLAAAWGPLVQLRQHYIRMAVAHLRRQIEPNPEQPRYLVTERGVGYRLEPDGDFRYAQSRPRVTPQRAS